MIEWLKNNHNTERGKLIIKFSLYMIFFIFVFLLVVTSNASLGSPKKNINSSLDNSNGLKEITYLEKQKKLLYDKYSFIYKIIGAENITFTGTYENFIVRGYKETVDNIIKFSIENNIVYVENLESREEYNDLFEGLDPTLFDLDNLFKRLNKATPTINKNQDNKDYMYDDIDGNYIIVKTNKDSIYEIQVNKEAMEYTFSYSY